MSRIHDPRKQATGREEMMVQRLSERARTREGVWRGESMGPVVRWLGVRYAAPPLDALRFRAADPPHPFSRERAATTPAPAPVQVIADETARRLLGAPLSEDCLRLNIWAPETVRDAAVLVWFHGGGYIGGSASQLDFDGARLAEREGILVVSVGYRTGALGYLDLRDALPDAAPTPGLTDQIQALRWLRENIDAFGGDPGRITIAGQSAGGNAVTTLLAVPAAQGLFRAAIAQSPPLPAAHRADDARNWGARFAGGLPAGRLRSIPPDVLARALEPHAELIAAENAGTLLTAPSIDGDLLPEHPADALARGAASPVPLLIGTNRHEAAALRGSRALRVDRDDLLRWFPDAAAARAALRCGYPGWPGQNAIDDLGTDLWFRLPAQEGALGHRAPTWMYELRHAPRGVGAALHGIEAGFLFGNTDRGMWHWLAPEGPDDDDRAVLDIVRVRWGTMVREGHPGHDWPPFDGARTTFILDARPTLEQDPRAEARTAVAGALSPTRERPRPRRTGTTEAEGPAPID